MNYKNCTIAWTEQRDFLNIALNKLQDHPLADIVRYLLSQTDPTEPDVKGMCQRYLLDFV